MSAPNQGRQSPEPERQPGPQLQEPVASNLKQGEGASKQALDDQLKNLSSNPVHPLAKSAEEKTSKK